MIDVRTLAFALTNSGHSLESGCQAFGIDYTKPPVVYGKVTPELIAYCREDVQATTSSTTPGR